MNKENVTINLNMKANMDKINSWLDEVNAIANELDTKLKEAEELEVEISFGEETDHIEEDRVKIFYNHLGAPELEVDGKRMYVVTLDYSFVTKTDEQIGTNLVKATGCFEGERELVTITFDKKTNALYLLS